MAVAEIRGGLGRHHGLSILTETFLNNIMKSDREQQEKKTQEEQEMGISLPHPNCSM